MYSIILIKVKEEMRENNVEFAWKTFQGRYVLAF